MNEGDLALKKVYLSLNNKNRRGELWMEEGSSFIVMESVAHVNAWAHIVAGGSHDDLSICIRKKISEKKNGDQYTVFEVA